MTLLLPKSPPLRSEAHLQRIREMPCCLCDAPPPSEAAHLRLGGQGGTGMKPGDDCTVPLCHAHHDKETKMGPRLFWATRLSSDSVFMKRVMLAFARSLVL